MSFLIELVKKAIAEIEADEGLRVILSDAEIQKIARDIEWKVEDVVGQHVNDSLCNAEDADGNEYLAYEKTEPIKGFEPIDAHKLFEDIFAPFINRKGGGAA